MKKVRLNISARVLLLPLILLLLFPGILSAGSLAISPIDPVIEDQQNSVALWLDNYEAVPVYLQIRVMRWSQENNKEHWEKQDEVVASPPFARLQQRQRQMIRLVKKNVLAPGEEKAYRIVIDEIAQDDKETEEQARQQLAMGLNLKMRYVLPLFVSGKGVWTTQDPKNMRDPQSATMPKLSWRMKTEKGQQYIEVRNSGTVHARLTAVNLGSGGNKKPIAEGLLGYVLPGATMSWPLPKNRLPNQGGQLEAMVNHFPDPMVIEKQ
ncbi:MAG: fimbrial biogenesis chaperone [Enterobacteriaceae bacterium]